MPRKILNTEARQKLAKARDRDTKLLGQQGWIFDGLWWYSPHTGYRYMRREALHIEELWKWGSGDSAFLNDKNHSMWVKAEEDDNKLTTMEDMSEQCKQRDALKRRALS